MNRRLLVTAIAMGLGLSASVPALAQAGSFPNKPVTIIVPFPPGGSTDAVVRAMAEKLSAKWGQTVLVDNKPGAGGNIGAALFARSEAGGYTLLAAPPGPLAINQNLFKGLNYDARTFVPVTMVATFPSVLVVSPHLKVNTLQELIAKAKQQPEKITFASQGNGSTSHLAGVLFQNLTGTKLVHVPYRGSGPALTEMAAGTVDMMFDNLTTSLPLHQGKRVNIITATSPARIAALPDVPTTAESGLPQLAVGTWVGLVAPAGTPAAVAQRIAADASDALKSPELGALFTKLGAEPVGGTPAAAGAFIKSEADKWKRVIDAAQITPE